MLLGYCFSTGNSIVKRALKAMTLVICVFDTLVTGNADRIPRQPSAGAQLHKEKQGAVPRQSSPTHMHSQTVITKCVSLTLLKPFFKKTQFSRSIIPRCLKVHVYGVCC